MAKTVRDIRHHAPFARKYYTHDRACSCFDLGRTRLDRGQFRSFLGSSESFALQVRIPGTLWQEALAGLPEQTAK